MHPSHDHAGSLASYPFLTMSQIKILLGSLGIFPTKRKGQNFLIDAAIARKMTAMLNLAKSDAVIEIGPGCGALTQFLLPECGKYFGIELDQKLASFLRNRFQAVENFTLMEKDVLSVDMGDLIRQLKQSPGIRCVKVIGNLPYRISTQILFQFLDLSQEVDAMVFSFQREVAQRLLAKSGGKDYGILSLKTALACDIIQKLKVSASCFYPRPEIDTGVLLMKSHDRYRSLSPRIRVLTGALIDAAFGKRRKTIRNALTSLSRLSYTVKDIEGALVAVNLEPRLRGEDIPLDSYVQLAVYLSEIEA